MAKRINGPEGRGWLHRLSLALEKGTGVLRRRGPRLSNPATTIATLHTLVQTAEERQAAEDNIVARLTNGQLPIKDALVLLSGYGATFFILRLAIIRYLSTVEGLTFGLGRRLAPGDFDVPTPGYEGGATRVNCPPDIFAAVMHRIGSEKIARMMEAKGLYCFPLGLLLKIPEQLRTEALRKMQSNFFAFLLGVLSKSKSKATEYQGIGHLKNLLESVGKETLQDALPHVAEPQLKTDLQQFIAGLQ